MFITGGSAGLGESLIEELSNYGVKEIAVMGRTAKLDVLEEQYPSVQFMKIQGDVAQLEDVKRQYKR